MITFRSLLICGVMLICVCMGCRKDVNPDLPAATQEGKNTFGCKVNDRIWLPRGSLGNDIPAGVDLSFDPTFNGGTMSLKAKYWFRDSKDEKIGTVEHIDISLGELSKPGTYSFNSEDSLALGAYSLRVQNENIPLTVTRRCYYDEVGDKRSGVLTITKLDMDKGILAGTFEFTLTKSIASGDCDRVLKITEGRFDMKF